MVYGSPLRKLRQKLWRDLGRHQCSIQDPWMAIGDFNIVSCKDEVNNPYTYVD